MSIFVFFLLFFNYLATSTKKWITNEWGKKVKEWKANLIIPQQYQQYIRHQKKKKTFLQRIITTIFSGKAEILKTFGMWNSPLLALLPRLLWPSVKIPVRVTSLGQRVHLEYYSYSEWSFMLGCNLLGQIDPIENNWVGIIVPV